MPRIILQEDSYCDGCGQELPKGSNVHINALDEIFCEECEEVDRN